MAIISSCAQKTNVGENPFFAEYETPFGVPPFDQIKTEHYLPAFQKGIDQNLAEIEAIVSNTEAPTFKNTILALEYSGETIDKVSSVFGNLLSAKTNEQLQSLAKDIYPALSKHGDEITMNPQLFEKVKTVYEQKDQLALNSEEYKLLEETYKNFVRSGANLSADKKEELKNINEQLSLLTLQFGDNMLAETNNYKLVIENEADLAGLSESQIAAAAEEAGEKGKWVFTLQKPSWEPFLQYAT